MYDIKNIFKLVFILLLGIFQSPIHASLAKAGAEKPRVATLAIAASAATATAAAGSANSAAAQKPRNQAILDARLIEYAKRADIIGVQQQLAKGANPDARTQEGKSVFEQAIHNYSHDKQKKRAGEHLAVAVMLMKAQTRSLGKYAYSDYTRKRVPRTLFQILDVRLVEAVEQANVSGVQKELARGARTYAANQEDEPVLHRALDGWLNDRKGKDKEYQEIAIELMKAGATLEPFQNSKDIRDDMMACLPHLVDTIPDAYRQTMYDVQGSPSWLHNFLAKAMKTVSYASSMKDKGDGDLERDREREGAIYRCVVAILDGGFDLVCAGYDANVYALLKRWDFYDERILGRGGPSMSNSQRHSYKRKRKNTYATIEWAYESFVENHQRVIQGAIEQVLPDPLLDLVYECLYIRPYEYTKHRIPTYIKELLAIAIPENGDRAAVEDGVAQKIMRYGSIGGYIPYTTELLALAKKQESNVVQKALDYNAQSEEMHNQIFTDDGPFVDNDDEFAGNQDEFVA